MRTMINLIHNSGRCSIRSANMMLMLGILLVTANAFASEGGMTGGGGGVDEACYSVEADETLTKETRLGEMICAETELMASACLSITGTEDCTGVRANMLRRALRNYR